MKEIIRVDDVEVDISEQQERAENLAGLEVKITDTPTYESAAGRLREIKARMKALEDERKAITRPLDASKKRIINLFRPVVESYQAAEKKIKAAMVAYDNVLEEKRRKEQEELEKIQAQAESAGIEIEEITVAEPERPQGISYREDWKFEVTDIEALPKKYMIPDEKTLAEIARSTKGLVEIPGVKFYPVKTPIARG